jgi:hypothetical protein
VFQQRNNKEGKVYNDTEHGYAELPGKTDRTGSRRRRAVWWASSDMGFEKIFKREAVEQGPYPDIFHKSCFDL